MSLCRAGPRLAIFVVALLAAADLRAQCTTGTRVTWPTTNPVWDFCFVRPSQSATAAGGNGSGLELREVKYQGVLILFQAHIPILNVKYAEVCGGPDLCYRDWLDQERAFECAPTISPGYCTGTTTTATTVCQHPGTDAGSFTGVAVEDFGTSLRLTAQCEAGWYRYIPVWEFFADGTLRARFDASSVNNGCVAYDHHHHSYFRLDFDVNASAGNYVDYVLPGDTLQRVTMERNFTDTSPARSKWRVGSAGSAYFVEVTRNPEDGAAGDAPPVPSDIAVADGWVLAYASNELSDYFTTISVCEANLNSFDNNQPVDGADVVMWVRASAFHVGEGSSQATDCSMVGPTIRVLPTTTPPVATTFHTLAPCRILDTRGPIGPYGGPALQPGGAVRDFTLAGQCGVPATAKSVSVNVTATEPSSAGHLTVYPAGGAIPPLASTLNFSAGQTRANNAILPLSVSGAITVQSAIPSGTVHFILDVTGWFE